ncbi:FAD-dependent monooxygenase [Streptosporangium sp. NBC_01756]|uniref:FAD-dependent monooxygenase n=1 Tax=Streptosporangium sp. NBC_01756 TaxID=2975950 RepID=UPI002DD9FC7D|nr:FAD-dependent monooxygenase [Streptosporangium sp. NBC_01756]WSC85380.1 FAD-dependent monooxygenase [Streptosporangium sp. NBC_01756]
MRVDIIGGGPAGLFLAILLRRDRFVDDVRLFERNEPDASAGWAVVFPEGSLDALARADPGAFEAIERAGVSWTQVEIRCRDSLYLVEGNRFHGIGRDALLSILRERATELGAKLHYGQRVTDLADHAGADLVVGADGPNSVVRAQLEHEVGPHVEHGSFWYGWFGIEAARPTFAYLFVDTEWGLFQGYVYPSGQSWSSLIIYVSEETRQRSGLSEMDVEESLRFCEQVFAAHLDGKPILRRGPAWTRFRHLRCDSWHAGNVVLIGDAAHTAHWSIGSGTRLALEDAIALATQLRAQPARIPDALAMYEKVRRDRVERFQDAARLSEWYFDNVRRYLDFEPIQFAYQLVARSWRITFADIAKRDPDFIRRFNAWFHGRATGTPTEIAPSPVFAPAGIGGLRLANRVVTTVPTEGAGLVIGAPPAPGRPAAALVSVGRLEPDLAAACDAGYQLALLDLTAHPVADLLVDPPGRELSALRARWPAGQPVGAVLGLAAGCGGALRTAETVALSHVLERSEVDVVLLRAAAGDPPPPGQVLQVADAVRNETGLTVIVDDGLRTLDAADTAIAAGRSDLCVLRFESDAGEA